MEKFFYITFKKREKILLVEKQKNITKQISQKQNFQYIFKKYKKKTLCTLKIS